jgi:uncharacterized protein (UPF0335 family)
VTASSKQTELEKIKNSVVTEQARQIERLEAEKSQLGEEVRGLLEHCRGLEAECNNLNNYVAQRQTQ